MQLAFLETHISKEVKKKAEKLMSSYKNLEAIIESKRMDLSAKMTVNYQASESQRSNQFSSETERLAYNNIYLDEYTLTKRKLDLVYYSLKPIQQRIWDQRYLMGRYDIDVYNDLGLPDRSYYRLKKDMIAVVAEALGMI